MLIWLLILLAGEGGDEVGDGAGTSLEPDPRRRRRIPRVRIRRG